MYYYCGLKFRNIQARPQRYGLIWDSMTLYLSAAGQCKPFQIEYVVTGASGARSRSPALSAKLVETLLQLRDVLFLVSTGICANAPSN